MVTFAPLLKHRLFPLPEAMEYILEMGSWAMGVPVEIEFAVTLSVPQESKKKLSLLQMRPLVQRQEMDRLDFKVPSRYADTEFFSEVGGTGWDLEIFGIDLFAGK